jgi:putative ABC transport system substrate-binding protein
MRRRQFIAGLGGVAAAWPLAARAQQTALPLVGLLNPGRLGTSEEQVIAFRRGLAETGYVEGRNVAIEYRWEVESNDTLAALAFDLVQRQVAAIVTIANTPTLVAAKATRTIPIVFSVGLDPVEYGLVASLARPGGNATGFATLTKELVGKRMSLLRQTVPAAASIAFLYDTTAEVYERENVQNAAHILGMQLLMIGASRPSDIEPAFADMVQQRAGALYVSPAPKLNSRNDQIAALALRHAIPTIFTGRTAVHAGGLMSYGTVTTTVFVKLASIPGAFSKARNRPTCRSCSRPSSSSPSTSRPPRRSVSPSQKTLLAIADEVIQ